MKTQKKQSILSCTPQTAFLFFLFIGSAFVFIGCTQLYKIIGLTDQQAAEQVAKDQESRQQIADRVRIDLTQLITTTIAGLGTIASGFLAKWLNTERKITTALITGIEKVDGTSVKQSIEAHATLAGIEQKLHKRVLALT